VKAPTRLLVKVSSTYYVPTSPENIRRHSETDLDISRKEHRRPFKNFDDTIINIQQAEKTENAEAMEATNCSVCVDAKADSVMIPCGHGGLCNACAIKMWERSKVCYLCRVEIEVVAQIPLTPSTWVMPKLTKGFQEFVEEA
jgi:hypothetical protein